jgi:nitroimidazol reductase NimA-like FMN-containing flavoprotein (pyridoxamine 5'-phosphate oxidase superfamily)
MTVTTETIYKELQNFNQPLGVLATVGVNGQPHATSVFYLVDEHLNIYFLVREGSKKYENILAREYVAFVVTEIHPPKTVQFEGSAHIVTDSHEENEYFTRLVARATSEATIPPVAQMEGSKMLFVKITPSWVRLGNFEVMREGDVFKEVRL